MQQRAALTVSLESGSESVGGVSVSLKSEPQLGNAEVDTRHKLAVNEYLVLWNDADAGRSDDGIEIVFEYRLEPRVGKPHRLASSIHVLPAARAFNLRPKRR